MRRILVGAGLVVAVQPCDARHRELIEDVHRLDEDGPELLRRSAREALVLAQTTDSPGFQADVFSDLATVLETAGLGDEADAALREALALYERKQIVPLAQSTRDRLAASSGVDLIQVFPGVNRNTRAADATGVWK